MSTKFKIWLPIIMALILITGIQIGFVLSPGKYKPSLFGGHKGSVTDEVYQYIRANYVDTVNEQNLMQQGVEGIISKLDPHSVYIPPTDGARLNEMLKGKFEGIGIEFYMLHDTLLVVDVLKGSPADKGGLLKGDRVIMVNDTIIAGKKIKEEDIFKKLRGAGGTKVKLGYIRSGKLGFADIIRGSIPSPSINAAFMMKDGIGYIKLDRFSETSYTEFIDAFNGLKKEGLTKLILDLRGNGGGLLDEATSIIDEFVDQKKIMVYTKGRTYGREDYKTRVQGVFEEGPLVLLIDEESASASEVIAGALQDYERATIIGRRSFGKGLVQHQYSLSNGGFLRLTVAKYYTPSGRCIQKPYNEDHKAYYHEVLERKDTTSSFIPADTTKYYTSKGRIVYGGGGITPDIVMPENNALRNDALAAILDRGSIQDFSYSYSTSYYNKLLSEYPTAKDFIAGFTVSKELYTSFLNSNNKLTGPAISPEVTLFIKNHIKASIARYLYTRDVFYNVLSETDPVLQRGIAELEKK